MESAALIPHHYLGPLSIYALLQKADCQIEVHETYQKRTIRNQMSILGPNGVQKLSVPLKKGKNALAIKDVEIAYDEDWVRDHLRSIVTAYKSSSYFDHYFYKIEAILNTQFQYLFELDNACQNLILNILDIKAPKETDNYTFPKAFQGYDHRLKKLAFDVKTPIYPQVFEHKFGFTPNLSILDLLFNMGPEMNSIISSMTFSKEAV